MLFDVQAALAEILSGAPATVATPATTRTETRPVSRLSQVSRSQAGAHEPACPAPVSQMSRVSRSQPAELSAADACAGQDASVGAMPRTWTGRVVSLDEWRALSRWDRLGPEGRIFCGACQEWVMPGGCPHCEGGAA